MTGKRFKNIIFPGRKKQHYIPFSFEESESLIWDVKLTHSIIGHVSTPPSIPSRSGSYYYDDFVLKGASSSIGGPPPVRLSSRRICAAYFFVLLV
jgi:hypothetical protein